MSRRPGLGPDLTGPVFQKIDAVESRWFGEPRSCRAGKRRKNIYVRGEAVDARTRGDSLRSTHQEGHANASLVNAALRGAKSGVESARGRPVVRHENHDAVARESSIRQGFCQASEILIENLHHAVELRGLLGNSGVGEGFPVLLPDLDRCVWHVCGQVEEERVSAILLDEFDSGIEEDIRAIAVDNLASAVAPENGPEVRGIILSATRCLRNPVRLPNFRRWSSTVRNRPDQLARPIRHRHSHRCHCRHPLNETQRHSPATPLPQSHSTTSYYRPQVVPRAGAQGYSRSGYDEGRERGLQSNLRRGVSSGVNIQYPVSILKVASPPDTQSAFAFASNS